MSAIAALRGYRTQFLYSLHYILSNLSAGYTFLLEGNEDMDVLDKEGELLYAIQLKNLNRTITLSDLLSESRTSFLKRFVEQYPGATPILVAYNEIGAELLNWKQDADRLTQKDKGVISKYKLTAEYWKLIKSKTVFQRVEEGQIYTESLQLLKQAFPIIDPEPTLDYLLTRVMAAAEARTSFTSAEFSLWIQHFAEYLSQRIAVHEQLGIYLRPLQSVDLRDLDNSLLEQEFFKASVTRFEHILLGLNVEREQLLKQVNDQFAGAGTVIITGASGQGKTTLAYDYAYRYASHSMLYELAIQQDLFQTQKSIQAVTAIGKRLDIPVLFIINVIPNTTDWVKLVKECSPIKNIRFLVTVRQEDWYRARAVGVEFAHKEVELTLTKSEAGVIYSKLNSAGESNRHLDFEEAWTKLGSNPPMLEFVYSVTQGDSLKNKLHQQIQQLSIEDARNRGQQIELLKLVSLADALGARINVANLKDAARFQFDIQKLEKEYLLRLTDGGKFLQGLHMVRSTVLIDLLFDELTSLKKEYVLQCLKLVAEEDLYIFLLQSLHLGLVTPADLRDFLRNDQDINWSIYGALLQAFLWAGIREYVGNNRTGLDEFRKIYAEGWCLTADVFFVMRVNFSAFIQNPRERAAMQLKVDELNKNIQDKEEIFNLAGLILNEIPLPKRQPQTPFQWLSLGQLLFWAKHIPNSLQLDDTLKSYDFDSGFKETDCEKLSKLMLGMHTYSPALSAIAQKLEHCFIDRLKKDYAIMDCRVESEEIQVNYVVDMFDKDGYTQTNDYVMTLIDLLRSAIPDRKKYSAQGHGHRMISMPSPVDNTRKSISVENLPLDEWTDINSTLINIYQYPNRPKNWQEYLQKLSDWEQQIKTIVGKFTAAFLAYCKKPSDSSLLRPVLAEMEFKSMPKIEAPQTIIDPLGIFSKRKSGPGEDGPQVNLKSRHDQFFKAFGDFKTSIEYSIEQTARTVNSLQLIAGGSTHIHNENIQRLSLTNLYSAIESFQHYCNLYASTFSASRNVPGHMLNENLLNALAVSWKDYLAKSYSADHSLARLVKMRNDFETRIKTAFKSSSTQNDYRLKYVNSEKTGNRPVIIVDAESYVSCQLGFYEAFNILREAIDQPEHTSLKSLMLNTGFHEIYFLQLLKGKSLVGHWVSFPLHAITANRYDELTWYHLVPKPIDPFVIKSLELQVWADRFPVFYEITTLAVEYLKLVTMVEHLHDIRYFNSIALDVQLDERLKAHIDKCGTVMNESVDIISTLFTRWANLDNDVDYIESEYDTDILLAFIKVNDAIAPGTDKQSEQNHIESDIHPMHAWATSLAEGLPSLGELTSLLTEKHLLHYSSIS